MALFIIGLIIGIGIFSYFIISLKKFVKTHNPGEEVSKVEGKTRTLFLALALSQGLATILSSVGLKAMKKWIFTTGESLMLVFGSYLLGTCFALAVGGFVLYYWKLDLDKKQRKISRILTFCGAFLAIIGLWLFTESIANQDIYPLISGFSFADGWSYGNEHARIKFYGIIIVFGAIIVYFMTDHYFYKKFKEHGLIDTLFIVAFLAGVLGARLWSCLVLEPDEYLHNFIGIFTEIKNGGLAIQGGVIGGAAVGIAYVLIFRRYVDIRFAMDVAIPGILLAQAIGRWGNFFNQEVYGFVTESNLLNLLPTIIRKNMYISGSYRVPLFFIESMINICGYFIIRYLFGRLLKFKEGLGYQSAIYFIWYGIVRVIMEPLRDQRFEYGVSIKTAYGMIIGGAVLLLVMIGVHVYRYLNKKEDKFGNKLVQAK